MRGMKTTLTGPGTFRLNGGAEAMNGQMTVTACEVDEWHHHEVRIVMSDSRPGGNAFDMVLSAEDAAHFASAIYSFAKVAIIKADHETDVQAVAA